jgi:transcriptional regulator with XRE-family HTH domain
VKRKLTEEEKLRQAQILARKITLLLDAMVDESGQPYDYPAIEAAAKRTGYEMSRTRWSMLKNGRIQVVPDECLRAIAAAFGVEPEYLLREDAKLPAQVEVKLPQVRIKRLYEVRDFATKALGRLDPEGLSAMRKILDQALQRKTDAPRSSGQVADMQRADEGPSHGVTKLPLSPRTVSVPVPAQFIGEEYAVSRTYATPKLDGHRVALRGRVLPGQHARATTQAARHGLSLSDYLAALIDRDSGLPTRLDQEQAALTPRASS